MNTILFTSRWSKQRWAAIMEENTKKNTEFHCSNALQFYFGTIIKKRQYELTPELVEIYSKYTVVDKNDIMINGLNLNYDFISQRIGIVKEQGIITSAYLSMRVRPDYNPYYYCYLLKAMDARKVFHGMGTGIRLTLSYKELRNILLPVPSRDEQDQIVRFLDWKVSGINKLISIRRRQISELEELKRSRIGQLVMGQSDVVPQRDTDISWVKTIPSYWRDKSLIQFAKEQQIKNAGMIEDNLLSLSYGKIINKDINTADGLLPASFEGYQIVHNGNVVLRLTDLQNDHKSLRTGLVTQTGIITSAYTCLKARAGMLPEYLQLQLHVADLCKVFYGMGGGVRQSIGFKDIRGLIIAVPPIDEQKRIVELVHKVEEPIDCTIQKSRRIITMLEELKNRLISDAVTGKIDVRGIGIPDYEFMGEDVRYLDEEVRRSGNEPPEEE